MSTHLRNEKKNERRRVTAHVTTQRSGRWFFGARRAALWRWGPLFSSCLFLLRCDAFFVLPLTHFWKGMNFFLDYEYEPKYFAAGAFSRVFRGRRLTDGSAVALKFFTSFSNQIF